MGCDDLPDNKGGGVQQDYLEKLVEQLRLELNRSTKTRDQQWLLCHLRANDWWIRQVDARRIAKKLRLTLLPAAPAEAADTIVGNTRGNQSNSLQTSASVQQSVQDSLEAEGNSASLCTASLLASSSSGGQTRSNPRGPGLTHTWTKINAAKPMAVPPARALNCQRNGTGAITLERGRLAGVGTKP